MYIFLLELGSKASCVDNHRVAKCEADFINDLNKTDFDQEQTCEYVCRRSPTLSSVQKMIRSGAKHFPKQRMFAQRRVRSACASAQADQSLLCSEDPPDSWLPTERPAKTQIRLHECAV